MAKLGEGDTRWIVSERADGTNVNNWHWTEKDVLEWSKKRFGQLLGEVELVADPCMTVKTTGVDTIEGEAFLNVRKKKLIPNYELNIKIKWEGEIRDGSGATAGTATGKLHLPYVAEENHGDDPEVVVLLDKEGAVENQLKQAILSKARGLIIKAVHTWEKEMHAGIPGGALKGEEASTAGAASASAKPAAQASKAEAKSAPPKPKAATSGSGHKITLTERFYARRSDIFEALTDPRRIMAFSQSPAEVVPEVGGSFSMYGGSVQGRFTELVPGERIVQDWRFSNWPDNHFSKVEIVLEEPEPGNTLLTFTQSNIPPEDKFGNHDVVGNCENGWKDQIFHRIKAVFGYGI
eukprot:CAMPEP_0117666788 /NCGR_PEP_ID=MMETSP0804-20121206/10577_1 /TAXON_ID=1074897 /ORGANISM="Tetraselmis astigmatica, Strain CCMP880" /LENGTH=349 /DNA_ID=CAMNT_0005474385 /DNA_START=93 /DNA_END=1142 /DNA_ORIENTATION=-